MSGRGVSKRPAYRVRIWCEWPLGFAVTGSKPAVYREAYAQARQAAQYGNGVIKQVQVMIRPVGSRQWGVLETVWRTGDPAPSPTL